MKEGIWTSCKGNINKGLMRDAVAVDGNSVFPMFYKVNLSTRVEVRYMCIEIKYLPKYLLNFSCDYVR